MKTKPIKADPALTRLHSLSVAQLIKLLAMADYSNGRISGDQLEALIQRFSSANQ